MNAIKIFYMSLVKENIAIFGVVQFISLKILLEVIYSWRIHNQRKRYTKGYFKNTSRPG